VAAARNTGLGRARGALIAFLDQDDEWLEHRLATQVRYLDEHPQVSIALAHMQMVLMQDTPRPPWFRPHWLTDAQPGYTPSTWLVRREAFARVGAFDTSFEVASDSDWLARAKDAGLGSAMLDEVLVRWRVHGANGTYDQQTMRREILRMARGSASRQRRATREQGESGRVA